MIIQTLSAVTILVIAVLFLNPGHLTMPETVVSMMSVGIILAFLTFAGFILKEKALDERENIHILKAGRLSYLVGVGTLILGVIVQGFNHEIDPWLVLALCAMVFSKLISRIYSQFKM
jgi:ABC-type nickel/cobalt efflux system permease component RcnA